MTKKQPTLTLVGPDADHQAPPPDLGEHGAELWRSITGQYDCSDAGGAEMLAQACFAADRAARCREIIDRDGELVKSRAGPVREHPLLKAELGARSFVVRTLSRLNLDAEPVRSGPGRPPGVA